MQAKILRVLQEKQLQRVGSTETIAVDVRLIAATHYDLKRRVAEGLFRQDLYYRIGVLTIELPPLRERGDDLQDLAQRFVERYGRELHRDVRSIATSTLSLMMRYQWPGNVRELQSVVKESLLNSSGYVLLPEFLPPALRDPAATSDRTAVTSDDLFIDLDRIVSEWIAIGSTTIYADCLQLMERRLITAVLKHTQGNLSQASRLLGIHRRTLRSKLHAFGLGSPEEE